MGKKEVLPRWGERGGARLMNEVMALSQLRVAADDRYDERNVKVDGSIGAVRSDKTVDACRR